MKDETPAGRPNDRPEQSCTDSEWTYGALADKRSADHPLRDAISDVFEAAEGRETRAKPLYGYTAPTGEYAVEGPESAGEWLVSSRVFSTGEIR